MTRFAFVTWDGGGNVPPAVGMAQELAHGAMTLCSSGTRCSENALRGGDCRSSRCNGVGSSTSTLRAIPPSASPGSWPMSGPAPSTSTTSRTPSPPPRPTCWSSTSRCRVPWLQRLQVSVPFAVLAHSAIAGLVPTPGSPIGAARLTATNRLRDRAGLPVLARLNEAWSGYPTLVTTIPALDPAAVGADSSVHYLGPIFESLPDERWDSPWAADDDRPLVLVSFTTTGFGTRAVASATLSRRSETRPFACWFQRHNPWTSGRFLATPPFGGLCPTRRCCLSSW